MTLSPTSETTTDAPPASAPASRPGPASGQGGAGQGGAGQGGSGHGGPGSPEPPRASVQPHARRPFQLIWLIPLVAAFVAAYLVYQTLSNAGPEITITFQSGQGITGGQTKVRHKAVDLGTVRDVRLSKDMNSVVARVSMTQEAARTLTDDARFWVVRPRLSAGDVSGLDTVLSGSYIEMDPGAGNAPRRTHFTGLDDPPAVRTGEKGVPVVLTASRIGSVQPGAPIFYRGIMAGEVSSSQLGKDGDGVTIQGFVRAPYDKFVRQSTHFWNTSGLGIEFGAQGIQVRVASLQAILSGGIAFDTPDDVRDAPAATPDSHFPLYRSEDDAASAGYENRIKLVAYFQGSVRGLSMDAPVEMYGIQIGSVTGIHLDLARNGTTSRVVVHMEIQPGRFMSHPDVSPKNLLAVAQTLVTRGLGAELQSASLITGQSVVEFTFQPNSAPVQVRQVNDEIEVPSTSGSFDDITSNLAQVAQKLGALPLDQIAANLNDALHGVSQLVAGPEMSQSLKALNTTLSSAQDVLRHIDSGTEPLLRRLPEIAEGLQAAVDRAGKLVSSTESGYGANSSFRRDLERLLSETSDTARSVRLLADYLDQHPEALIRGRAGR